MSEGCLHVAGGDPPQAMVGAESDCAAAGLPRLLVNIDVDDLERATTFYTAAFGLQPGRRFGADGIELRGSSSAIYLLVKPAGSQPAQQSADRRHYGRHWTPVHLDFVVDDIDLAVKSAIAAGALVERPVQASAWGKLALMADPFGHGFCFVQFLGRGYDEIAQAPVAQSEAAA